MPEDDIIIYEYDNTQYIITHIISQHTYASTGAKTHSKQASYNEA